MRRSLLIIGAILIGWGIQAQEIPDVHSKMGKDENGIFVKKGARKIYAMPDKTPYTFQDFHGHPKGTEKGIALDFNYEALNGTLYYGFMNYGDADYPQPVFFKRTA